MKKLLLAILVLLSVKIVSVAQNTTKVNDKESLTKKNETKFVIKQNPEDENGNPSSNIALSFGNKTTKVDKVTGNAELIDKSEYLNKGIPKKALSACGAWWAGAGDYFYVTKVENRLVIYKGWQDETQTDKSYHWKKFKVIK
ncbi:hypothetical protein EMA8858_01504 [Emticicia aquatica]|jgi:hypothetical protein|uniref:Uncharacterized protein n=1 Tax=Emticicia aquatica TaxID=1681835 RepID=A0ABN8ER67_9BACT|nr:hypothetical protein [Emticicia aquatica]CAH0995383.1 hypothetical protein EMA8858_01504 [Emticicia aquatica]